MLPKMCVDRRVEPLVAAENAVEHSEENIPTLIVPGLGNTTLDSRLAGVIVSGKKLQQNFEISVAFMEGDGRVIDRVRQHMQVWLDYVNLKFRFTDDPDAFCRIAFKEGEGSWSYLGPDNALIPKQEPTMNFGWLEHDTPDVEYQRVVPHEVGHLFGMTHEHMHPYHGIPWDRPAVYKKMGGAPNYWTKEQIDNNYFNLYSESQTQFSSFDRESIMLYAIPNDLTIGDWSVGWNTKLSDTDKRFMAEQYPKAMLPPPIVARRRSSITRVAERGVKERTLVTKNGKDFFWAEPL